MLPKADLALFGDSASDGLLCRNWWKAPSRYSRRPRMRRTLVNLGSNSCLTKKKKKTHTRICHAIGIARQASTVDSTCAVFAMLKICVVVVGKTTSWYTMKIRLVTVEDAMETREWILPP